MVPAVTIANRNESKRQFFPRPFGRPPFESALSPQAAKVLELIRRDGHVSRLTALHYGIANLTARIAELRFRRFAIDCKVKADGNGNKYGSWFLADE